MVRSVESNDENRGLLACRQVLACSGLLGAAKINLSFTFLF